MWSARQLLLDSQKAGMLRGLTHERPGSGGYSLGAPGLSGDGPLSPAGTEHSLPSIPALHQLPPLQMHQRHQQQQLHADLLPPGDPLSEVPPAPHPQPHVTPPGSRDPSPRWDKRHGGGWQVIEADTIDLQETIGHGAYGTVSRAFWKYSEVAVKELTKLATQELGDDEPGALDLEADSWKDLRHEVDMLGSLTHPKIVRFLAVCWDPPMIVMEYYPGGSLFRLLERAHRGHERAIADLSWLKVLQMLRDIAEGMWYLHSHDPPVVHGDLRSPNLLLHQGHNRREVKLADFGLARVFVPQACFSKATNPRWLAPEVIRSSVAHTAGDVYSYGMIMYETLTWTRPYEDMTSVQIIAKVANSEGHREHLRPDVPPDNELPGNPGSSLQLYKELMRDCWAEDPSKRPQFDEVINRVDLMLGMDAPPERHRAGRIRVPAPVHGAHSPTVPPSSPSASGTSLAGAISYAPTTPPSSALPLSSPFSQQPLTAPSSSIHLSSPFSQQPPTAPSSSARLSSPFVPPGILPAQTTSSDLDLTDTQVALHALLCHGATAMAVAPGDPPSRRSPRRSAFSGPASPAGSSPHGAAALFEWGPGGPPMPWGSALSGSASAGDGSPGRYSPPGTQPSSSTTEPGAAAGGGAASLGEAAAAPEPAPAAAAPAAAAATAAPAAAAAATASAAAGPAAFSVPSSPPKLGHNSGPGDPELTFAHRSDLHFTNSGERQQLQQQVYGQEPTAQPQIFDQLHFQLGSRQQQQQQHVGPREPGLPADIASPTLQH